MARLYACSTRYYGYPLCRSRRSKTPELQLRQLSWPTYTRGKRQLWQLGLRTGDLGLYGNFWMQQGYTCLWMIRGTHFVEANEIMGLPIPTHHEVLITRIHSKFLLQSSLRFAAFSLLTLAEWGVA